MPFDGVPEGLVSDLVKLRIALDGVRTHWREGAIGRQTDATHCAIGWLLVATEWNRDEAVRLALDYVYPALPEKARDPSEGRLEAIASYNDNGSASRIEKLFTNACQLAERRVVR
jgi:hypothetical protein